MPTLISTDLNLPISPFVRTSAIADRQTLGESGMTPVFRPPKHCCNQFYHGNGMTLERPQTNDLIIKRRLKNEHAADVADGHCWWRRRIQTLTRSGEILFHCQIFLSAKGLLLLDPHRSRRLYTNFGAAAKNTGAVMRNQPLEVVPQSQTKQKHSAKTADNNHVIRMRNLITCHNHALFFMSINNLT